MNPLDRTGQEFHLSLMNPNPKAARLKDGPRYRVEFEVDQETFDQFMGARELAGMVIECRAEVAAVNEPLRSVGGGAEGAGANTALEDTERQAPGKTLAQRMHIEGYFRNPNLWKLLHERAIYTLAEHKRWIEALPCLARMLKSRDPLLLDLKVPFGGHLTAALVELACEGQVCLHHVASAGIAPGGRDQPDAPRKVPHFYGVPLCSIGHHAGWAHAKYATREDKEKLLEVAVALTAHQVKAAIKTYIGIESLTELTQEMLDQFEAEVGLKGA